MKNRTNFNRRVGVRLTDGQFYTLQNLANFHNMTITDFIKKSCKIANIPEQAEFIPVVTENGYELIDNTPDSVKEGRVTLKEWHDTNDFVNLEHKYEDLEEEVNKLFNREYCNPDYDYSDEETGRTLKGDAGLPARADELCYIDCINIVADRHKVSKDVTRDSLITYIKTKKLPDFGDEQEI